MTDLRKAAEMALEALEEAASCVQHSYLPDSMGHDWDKQIEALRQALAQPKREWVGLTDEEIQDAMDYWSDDEHSDFGGAYQADSEYFNVRESWRYIEAKLKEKNA